MRTSLTGLAITICLLVAISAPLGAQTTPVAVTTQPFSFSRLYPDGSRFGRLRWRGGIVLSSKDDRFGGFSGMVISADGKRIIAVSDDGWWFESGLTYEKNKLTGIRKPQMAPLITSGNKRSGSKSRRDAEALAVWDKRDLRGRLLVGFERRERVALYNIGKRKFAARPRLVRSPKSISSGRQNKELESVARFLDGPRRGWLAAISERNLDASGNIRGWFWRNAKTIPFSLKRHEDYAITDMAVLPGGRHFITAERSFSPGSLPGFAIRQFDVSKVKPGATISGSMIFEGRQPVFRIDNMEGIAVHHNGDELRITVISDDNYNRSIQRTLIMQFALAPRQKKTLPPFPGNSVPKP